MQDLIKGYLIDPEIATITEVLLPRDDIDAIYALIDADCFDLARITVTDSVFVDDNGFYTKNMFAFRHDAYHSPLCGKGLVLGSDSEGYGADASMSLDDLYNQVKFYKNTSEDAVYAKGCVE